MLLFFCLYSVWHAKLEFLLSFRVMWWSATLAAEVGSQVRQNFSQHLELNAWTLNPLYSQISLDLRDLHRSEKVDRIHPSNIRSIPSFCLFRCSGWLGVFYTRDSRDVVGFEGKWSFDCVVRNDLDLDKLVVNSFDSHRCPCFCMCCNLGASKSWLYQVYKHLSLRFLFHDSEKRRW